MVEQEELYCVFWYPTIFHKELQIISSSEQAIEISDKVGEAHHVTLNVTCDASLSPKLVVKSTHEKKTATIILEQKNFSRNGLVLYSYKAKNTEETQFLKEIIPTVVYHLAKNIYHKHELNADSDSMLEALMSDTTVDLKQEDNKALEHYFKLYEKKFLAYVATIGEMKCALEEQANSQEYTYAIIKKKRQLFDDICKRALIEYTYCKTLLYSKYNQGCRAGNTTNGLYRIAINIENALRYIRVAKEANWNEFTHSVAHATQVNIEALERFTSSIDKSVKSGDKISKRSIWLGGIGSILGGIGVLPVFYARHEPHFGKMAIGIIVVGIVISWLLSKRQENFNHPHNV
jgi:hypothetical protein